MKENKRKGLSIAILSMLVLSVLAVVPILPAEAQPQPKIYLVPKNYLFTAPPATSGQKFIVTVMVSDVPSPGMMSYQIAINYNSTILNATGWVEPTTNASYVFFGNTTLKASTFTPGQVIVGSALFPFPAAGQIQFIGSGLICLVEFEIMKVPTKLEKLMNCSLHINKTETFLLAYDGVTSYEIPNVIKEDGYYEITWTAPPLPKLAVRGEGGAAELKFGPWPPSSVCTLFWAAAYVEDLEEAWGLNNATFKLHFNNTLIAVMDIDVGPKWGTSVVTNTTGQIVASLDAPTESLKGTVMLINVTFHIAYQDTVPPRSFGEYDDTYIDFCDYTLYDPPDGIIADKTTKPCPVTPCHVIIYALMTLPMPWLEVIDPTDGDHDIVFGPEPSLGKEFDVNVIIKNLHPEAKMVAYQFRLIFDDTLLEGVSITEGPFLQDTRWNKFGTLFIGRFDPEIVIRPTPIPPCAVVAGVLWPDPATGDWTVPPMDSFPCAEGPDVDSVALGVDPPADPVLATIRFRIIKDGQTVWPPENLGCNLEFMDFPPDGYGYFIDKFGEYITPGTHINGTYTLIWPPWVGRVIDVYGGVDCTPFPSPYGGQGLNRPMDMVWPQKEVCLYAKVTYNFWPVQDKLVSFEVEGPFDVRLMTTAVNLRKPIGSKWTLIWPYEYKYKIVSWHDNGDGVLGECDNIDTINLETGDIEWWHIEWIQLDGLTYYMQIRYKVYPPTGGAWFLYKDTAITDKDGIAKLTFRMPWQGCEDPERFFGIYRVTATVDIACEVVIDRLYFHYDYLVRIFEVTTDKYYYKHCETVKITVRYGTHAMQLIYPAEFFVSIKDELNVPIGKDIFETTVGGAVFCKYRTSVFVAYIHVPKWAFSGYATVHVNCFNMNPTLGGFAWCPTYKPYPIIYIKPE